MSKIFLEESGGGGGGDIGGGGGVSTRASTFDSFPIIDYLLVRVFFIVKFGVWIGRTSAAIGIGFVFEGWRRRRRRRRRGGFFILDFQKDIPRQGPVFLRIRWRNLVGNW